MGELMAAVLSCGEGAVLSHDPAGWVWGIRPPGRARIEVSVPAGRRPRRRGVGVHRRRALRSDDVTRHHGIPVTTPVQTLINVATRLGRPALEAAINEADNFDLVDPETLRRELDARGGPPGVARLRETLDIRTLTMTDTELERRFLPIARKAGLPLPETQRRVNGFRVDFYWPRWASSSRRTGCATTAPLGIRPGIACATRPTRRQGSRRSA